MINRPEFTQKINCTWYWGLKSQRLCISGSELSFQNLRDFFLLFFVLVLFKNIVNHLEKKEQILQKMQHKCCAGTSLLFCGFPHLHSWVKVYLELKLVLSYKWLMVLIWSVWRSGASRWGTAHLQNQKGESSTLRIPAGPNPLCTVVTKIPGLVSGDTVRESWNWRRN